MQEHGNISYLLAGSGKAMLALFPPPPPNEYMLATN